MPETESAQYQAYIYTCIQVDKYTCKQLEATDLKTDKTLIKTLSGTYIRTLLTM